MKKKSLVAMGLAGVMTIGMCVPVLADGTVNQDSDPKTGKADVTYTEPEIYSITIPANVSMGPTDTDKSMIVTIDENTLKLPYGKSIKVTSDADTDLKLTLTDNSDSANTIQATVEKPDSNIFNKDNLAGITYKVSKPSTVDYSGIYTGNITFTIALEANVAP